ncbi:Tetracycline resistance protein from transposon Tn4351/Tn4400 [Talaromyces islandicus]|uniref:Tetracycline resistance protein from transposon Tn4351/Tn4400 n=1 Tax=Talaromyces islandicus TaxID=28573 RepID=A0A0U1M8U2_TALIS|nr:Tetracycline resistance protein from transposon Tn4351/Tn4400 [Talaromyces islandicus]
MAVLPRIAIVGAGPAGLTLARLLQRHSIPCRIFERDADRFARGQGGSLDLHEGSAQIAIKEAGLYDQFMKHARPEGEVLKIYNPENQILLSEGDGQGGRPSEFNGRPEIDRSKLRELLLDSLEPSSVTWARKLRRVQRNEVSGVTDLYFGNEKDEEKEEGFDLVVGGDGGWSKVRQALTSQQPVYSGVGGLDLRLSDIDKRNPRLAARVGPGMCLTLGESRGLMAQRNGDGSVRVYAFVRQPEEEYSHLAAEIATNPASVKQKMLDQFYSDWHEEAQSLVLNADDEIYLRPMYMLPVGLTWETKPGVTVIGDAAHLMTPFAGVGVNVAMEDALELSREIRTGQDAGEWTSQTALRQSLAQAIQRYEKTMWARAEENAQATWMYLGLFFNPRGGHAMIEHFEKEKAKEAGH